MRVTLHGLWEEGEDGAMETFIRMCIGLYLSENNPRWMVQVLLPLRGRTGGRERERASTRRKEAGDGTQENAQHTKRTKRMSMGRDGRKCPARRRGVGGMDEDRRSWDPARNRTDDNKQDNAKQDM